MAISNEHRVTLERQVAETLTDVGGLHVNPPGRAIAFRRGAFLGVRDLIDAIRAYIDIHDHHAVPATWTAPAERILEHVTPCRVVAESLHAARPGDDDHDTTPHGGDVRIRHGGSARRGPEPAEPERSGSSNRRHP